MSLAAECITDLSCGSTQNIFKNEEGIANTSKTCLSASLAVVIFTIRVKSHPGSAVILPCHSYSVCVCVRERGREGERD